MRVPSEADAIAIVGAALGREPRRVDRFRNGLAHYAVDVDCGNSRVVARLGRPGERVATAAWHRLQEAGVPVPEVLAAGGKPFPYLILERLAGTDLGDVYDTLEDAENRRVAGGTRCCRAGLGATLKLLPGYGYARSYDDPGPPRRRGPTSSTRDSTARVRAASSRVRSI